MKEQPSHQPVKLAGCLVGSPEGKALLLHSKSGAWEFPYAKLEEGESPFEASGRSLQDELGCVASIRKQLAKVDFEQDGQKFEYSLFLGVVSSGHPAIANPDSYDNLAWMSQGEINGLKTQLSQESSLAFEKVGEFSLARAISEDASDFKWMKEAISIAEKSREAQPCGCIIVKDGQAVGIGFNDQHATHDATAHAEINAIRHACLKLQSHNLGGCSVYCTHEPCAMCFTAMQFAGVGKLVYGLPFDEVWPSEARIARINFEKQVEQMEEPIRIVKNYLKDECSVLLR